MFYPWYWLDPLLSVLIVAFILKNGWGLLKESTAVLMNATPGHIDLEKVRTFWPPAGSFGRALPACLAGLLSPALRFPATWWCPTSRSAAPHLAESIRHELLHRFRIDHPVCNLKPPTAARAPCCAKWPATARRPYFENSKRSRPGMRKALRVSAVCFHALRLALGPCFCTPATTNPESPGFCPGGLQLPDSAGWRQLGGLVLPWLELLLGLCLVSGFWLPGATVMSTGLLAVFIGHWCLTRFAGWIFTAAAFQPKPQGPADLWTVARDLFSGHVGYLALCVFFFRPALSNPWPNIHRRIG